MIYEPLDPPVRAALLKRMDAGVSVSEIARRAGLGRQTVTDALTGARKLTRHTRAKLAHYAIQPESPNAQS